jgi:hypothetical protein
MKYFLIDIILKCLEESRKRAEIDLYNGLPGVSGMISVSELSNLFKGDFFFSILHKTT